MSDKILTKAELIGRDYKPKNGEGYKLLAGKTYTIKYYESDMTFKVIYE